MKRTDFFSGISGSGADTFIFWKGNIAKSEMSWLIIIRPAWSLGENKPLLYFVEEELYSYIFLDSQSMICGVLFI